MNARLNTVNVYVSPPVEPVNFLVNRVNRVLEFIFIVVAHLTDIPQIIGLDKCFNRHFGTPSRPTGLVETGFLPHSFHYASRLPLRPHPEPAAIPGRAR